MKTIDILEKAGNPNNGNNGNAGNNSNNGNGNNGGNSNDENHNDCPDVPANESDTSRIEFFSICKKFYSIDLSLFPMIQIYESETLKNSLVLKLENCHGRIYSFYANRCNKVHKNCDSILVSLDTFINIVYKLKTSYTIPEKYL